MILSLSLSSVASVCRRDLLFYLPARHQIFHPAVLQANLHDAKIPDRCLSYGHFHNVLVSLGAAGIYFWVYPSPGHLEPKPTQRKMYQRR